MLRSALKQTPLAAIFLLVLFLSCNNGNDPDPNPNPSEVDEKLTIFFINDPHGQMTNFAKIKHIVDEEKEKNPTLLVSAGDIFSGSPYVDQYQEKGFPMIDIMNRTGFDISVIGNHEFDYGLETLQERIDQSEFAWVCANVNVNDTELEQPDAYKTLTAGDFRVTFLGLVETFGRQGRVVPATHPWKIEGLEFQQFDQVVGQYENLKEQEDADLLIALTHLGGFADRSLATDAPFLDMIIGGHTNDLATGAVNGIPTVMAGFDLFWLGKAELTIKDKELVDYDVSLIELWNYRDRDENLLIDIENYTQDQRYDEVLGFSASEMDEIGELGCFYTEALSDYMQVDATIQNTGGIREQIDQGDITRLEIYEMDPFDNGSVVYEKTVGELKTFLQETRLGIAFTGIDISAPNDVIIIRDSEGEVLSDEHVLRLGINDFIVALYDEYFPVEQAQILPQTTAESIIGYLTTIQSHVDFEGCQRIFRY